MTVWYKINPNRFTYRELWRTSGRGLWPLARAVWRKWFDIQLPPTSGFSVSDSLEFVDLDSLPDRPREMLQHLIAAVKQHGFRYAFCHKKPHLGDIELYTAILISADGMSLANVGWLRIGAHVGTKLALGSRTQTQRLLTDTDPHRDDPPPEFDIWHLPTKSVDDLIVRHSRRLDQLGREQILPATESEIAARIIENQGRYRDFKLARGVFVPLTQEEVDRLSGIVTANGVAETGNPFQSPREDEIVTRESHVASPIANKSWQAAVVAGFIVAALIAEADAWYNGFDVLRMHLYTWLYVCIAYVAWPFSIGIVGAAVGLAVWFIRRAFWRWIP